jgi:hypothetical protein
VTGLERSIRGCGAANVDPVCASPCLQGMLRMSVPLHRDMLKRQTFDYGSRSMLRRQVAHLLAVVLSGTMAGACGSSGSAPVPEIGLSFKLAQHAFLEYGTEAHVMVGTRAARYRDDTGYMPLEVAIANARVRTLVLTLGSFTLVDAAGGRYSAVDAKELRQRYRFLDMDRTVLSELADMAASVFDGFGVYPSKFTPTQRAMPATPTTLSLVRETALLPQREYLVDYVYFPKPQNGILGQRFDLLLFSPSLADSVLVTFAVR